jgi:hypothetical protein
VEQELVTFLEHLSSSRLLGGLYYSIFISMCMFCRSLFVLLSFFFLVIVLSVLLRFMDSNYPIGIFKLILQSCTVYMKSYARACVQYS